jgi:chaperonin GroES
MQEKNFTKNLVFIKIVYITLFVKLLINLFCCMAIKLKPLHDRVIVKRLPAETKTAGGIIIPDNATEKPMKGEVIAVGSGAMCDGKCTPLVVKVGDIVLFGKYAGTEFKNGSDELLIMKESDILAIIEE